MIISKKYAQALIRAGKAVEIGTMHDDQYTYWIISRTDTQRVDHVRHAVAGPFWHLSPLTKLGRSENV